MVETHLVKMVNQRCIGSDYLLNCYHNCQSWSGVDAPPDSNSGKLEKSGVEMSFKAQKVNLYLGLSLRRSRTTDQRDE